MDKQKQIEQFTSLNGKDVLEVFDGVDGYSIPLMRRVESRANPIKQIINGKSVALMHERTDYLVNQVISQRATHGLHFKNLILYEDRDLKIEISNPDTLKETRYLPKGFKFDMIFAVFGDYVSIGNLDVEKPYGLLLKDKDAAESFGNLFDLVWESGVPV